MDENKIQTQIDEINRKLDIILNEVSAQKNLRLGIEDLRDDLTRVGTDVFRSATSELEELTDNMETGDFMLLARKLLRNTNNIKAAFEQLESMRDFVEDFSSISGDMFNSVLLKLDELDRKGYFELLRETEKSLDKLVSSVTPEDLKRINDAIPILVDILKRLSQPELLEKVKTAVTVYENYSFDPNKSPSTVKLLREMTSPEVKKGMLFMLGLLKNIVNEFDKKGEL